MSLALTRDGSIADKPDIIKVGDVAASVISNHRQTCSWIQPAPNSDEYRLGTQAEARAHRTVLPLGAGNPGVDVYIAGFGLHHIGAITDTVALRPGIVVSVASAMLEAGVGR